MVKSNEEINNYELKGKLNLEALDKQDGVLYKTTDEGEIRNLLSFFDLNETPKPQRIVVYGDGKTYFDTKKNRKIDHNNSEYWTYLTGNITKEEAKGEIKGACSQHFD